MSRLRHTARGNVDLDRVEPIVNERAARIGDRKLVVHYAEVRGPSKNEPAVHAPHPSEYVYAITVCGSEIVYGVRPGDRYTDFDECRRCQQVLK